MNRRIKQKIENAVAADYERTRAAGKEWTLANAKTMACAMYGPEAEPIVHNYFLRLFDIVETPATRRDDMIESLREYWAREPYEVPTDVQSQFAPAINDRSNKE